MALEPIYEAEFHDSSYGFRPNRSTHHAVFRCQQMMQKGFAWVNVARPVQYLKGRILPTSLGILRGKLKNLSGKSGRILSNLWQTGG
jgi:hypothetical protein